MPLLLINNTIIKTIIFDFDGTLAKLNIDFKLMRQAVFELISAYGIAEKDRQGEHILEVINFVNELLVLKSPQKAAAFKQEAYELIEKIELSAACNGELFSRTKELLQQLSCYHIVSGVITRNCSAAIYTVFPDILSYCPVVVCRESVKNVKPHPEHLNMALQLTGSKAENSLMIGDHPLDIETGRNAGTLTAGVLTGNFQRDDFIKTGADLILTEAAQILKMII
jgi:phosphoglycolate phosphatase